MTITASRYEAVHQGGPFKVAEYEVAPPGPNEVVVRNKAVALNPMDWKQLWGTLSSSFEKRIFHSESNRLLVDLWPVLWSWATVAGNR